MKRTEIDCVTGKTVEVALTSAEIAELNQCRAAEAAIDTANATRRDDILARIAKLKQPDNKLTMSDVWDILRAMAELMGVK